MYDQNLNFSQISQNGQKGQVNLDEVSGIHAIGYACLDLQTPCKWSKEAN